MGVNRYTEAGGRIDIPLLEITGEMRDRQIGRLQRLKQERDGGAVAEKLAEVRRVCEAQENVMPALIAAAQAYCTLGETIDVMRDVFGTYRESASF